MKKNDIWKTRSISSHRLDDLCVLEQDNPFVKKHVIIDVMNEISDNQIVKNASYADSVIQIDEIFNTSSCLSLILSMYYAIVEYDHVTDKNVTTVSLRDVLVLLIIPEIYKSRSYEHLLIYSGHYNLIASQLVKIMYIVTNGKNLFFINEFRRLKQTSIFGAGELLQLIDYIEPELRKKQLFIGKFSTTTIFEKFEENAIIRDKVISPLFAAAFKRNKCQECPISRLTPDALKCVISFM